MRGEADRILELVINSSLTLARTSGRLDLTQDEAGRQMVRKIQPINDLSLCLSEVAADERVLGPMRQLMGDEPVLMEREAQLQAAARRSAARLAAGTRRHALPGAQRLGLLQGAELPAEHRLVRGVDGRLHPGVGAAAGVVRQPPRSPGARAAGQRRPAGARRPDRPAWWTGHPRSGGLRDVVSRAAGAQLPRQRIRAAAAAHDLQPLSRRPPASVSTCATAAGAFWSRRSSGSTRRGCCAAKRSPRFRHRALEARSRLQAPGVRRRRRQRPRRTTPRVRSSPRRTPAARVWRYNPAGSVAPRAPADKLVLRALPAERLAGVGATPGSTTGCRGRFLAAPARRR